MGEMGLLSRVLCGRYGSPFTYASFSPERELAPGQISFDEMRDVYHYDRIDANTALRRAGRSDGAQPEPARAERRRSRRPGSTASTCRCASFNSPSARRSTSSSGWDIRGYSVTIPHKEAVLEEMPRHDEMVDEIGAANTLYRD